MWQQFLALGVFFALLVPPCTAQTDSVQLSTEQQIQYCEHMDLGASNSAPNTATLSVSYYEPGRYHTITLTAPRTSSGFTKVLFVIKDSSSGQIVGALTFVHDVSMEDAAYTFTLLTCQTENGPVQVPFYDGEARQVFTTKWIPGSYTLPSGLAHVRMKVHYSVCDVDGCWNFIHGPTFTYREGEVLAPKSQPNNQEEKDEEDEAEEEEGNCPPVEEEEGNCPPVEEEEKTPNFVVRFFNGLYEKTQEVSFLMYKSFELLKNATIVSLSA